MATYKSDGLRISTYTNGVSGRSIDKIENFYYASHSDDADQLPEKSSSDWKKEVANLTNPFNGVNKYLWNFEKISYTKIETDTSDPEPTITDPTILGTWGRGYDNIYEYYIVTNTDDAPDAPEENDDGTWPDEYEIEGVGKWIKEKSGVTLPKASKDTPYLWNFEVLNFNDNSDQFFGPTCVGTYGNSISTTVEYYCATAKRDDKPNRYSNFDKKIINTDVWKTDISQTGQSATRPYLWNFERTNYSLSDPHDTEVSLLSSESRGIKNITEYYQISPTEPTGASSSDGDIHNNMPIIPEDWYSIKPDLSQGQTLWNFEVIEYSASDTEGKNLYSWTSPSVAAYMARDGKDALTALTLSLTNDFDIVPADNAGIVDTDTALGGATTKVKAYKYGVEESGTINCSVMAHTSSGEVEVDSSNYTFSNNEFKLTNWDNDANWSSVTATFTYTATIEEKDMTVERVFVISRMNAEPGKDPIDYYLEILPNSKNTSAGSGNVTIRAKKQEGTAITDISGASGVAVKYGNTTMSGNMTNGYVYSYTKNQEGEIDFLLYINNVLWDNETLLLVKNGDEGISFTGVAKAYKATSTSNKPTDTPNETTFNNWKSTPSAAGFNETNKYLWVFEKVGSTKTNSYTPIELSAIWSLDGRSYEQSKYFYLTNNSAGNYTEVDVSINSTTGEPTAKTDGNWKTDYDALQPGQALWIAEYQKFSRPIAADSNIVWTQLPVRLLSYVGADGQGESGVSLTVSSYFAKSTDTTTIHIERNHYGDATSEKIIWKWFAKVGSNAEYEVTTTSSNANIYKTTDNDDLYVKPAAFGSSDEIQIRVAGYDGAMALYQDYTTLKLIADGSDAYVAFLTNPHAGISADKDGNVTSGTQISTNVVVLKGTTPQKVTLGTVSHDHFSISQANGNDSSLNASIIATVKTVNNKINLGNANSCSGVINIPITSPIAQTLQFNWTKTNTGATGSSGTSPYLIELDNDSATIGTNSSGGGYTDTLLQKVSTINVTVFEGKSDITTNCGLAWSSTGGTLQTNSGKTNYFKSLASDTDTSTATVVVTKSGTKLGEKTFTISKNKQGIKGDNAVTYVLSVSPNSWNVSDSSSMTPTFSVTKYVGDSSTTAPMNEYQIRKSGSSTNWGGGAITATTTFDLYIKNSSGAFAIKADSETVSAVQNGNDSMVAGPQGYSGATLTLYQRATSAPTNKPGELTYTFSSKALAPTNALNGWSTTIPAGTNTCYAIYAYASSNTNEDKISNTEWSDPIVIEGQDGDNGFNTATIFLYQRAASKPTKPGSLTYTFSTGELSGTLNGWSQTIPAANGNPCYFIQEVAVSKEATKTITAGDWSEPEIYNKDGTDGNTIKTVYAYYRKDNSTLPSKPNNGGSLPTGWSFTPWTADTTYPFVFVSQCTVTNTTYGEWTSPTCWAKYGKDGSDASVTDINVFNALTSNRTKFGCFQNDDGALYINAQYLKSGTVESDLVLAGHIAAQNIDATGGKIGGWDITSGRLAKDSVALITDNSELIEYKDNKSSPIRFKSGSAPRPKKEQIKLRVSIGQSGLITGITDITQPDQPWKCEHLGDDIYQIYSLSGFDLVYLESSNTKIGVNCVYIDENTSHLQFTLIDLGIVGASIDITLTAYFSLSYDTTFPNFYILQDGTMGINQMLVGPPNCPIFLKTEGSAVALKHSQLKLTEWKTTCGFQSRGGALYFNTQDPTNSYITFRGPDTSTALSYDGLHFLTSHGTAVCSIFTQRNDSSGEVGAFGIHINIRGIKTVNFWQGNTQFLKTVKTPDGTVSKSDINAKNSIETLSLKYETLFDKLIPSRYKYNEGTSNRYHIGFIAQEVNEAINIANLTSQEFAGLCFENLGGESEYWGLRYEEFIPINTWQIQKLKPRMTAAETKIASLELEISQLKTEIQNLKNTQNSAII